MFKSRTPNNQGLAGGRSGLFASKICRDAPISPMSGPVRLPLCNLPAFKKPVTKKVLQFWNCMNLADGGLDIVRDATEPDAGAVEQNVARPPIPITWLAYRPDITNNSVSSDEQPYLALLRSNEVPLPQAALDKDPGNVGMAVEANTTKVQPKLSHLPLIVNILRKDVLVQVIPGRAVDIQYATLLVAAGKARQEADSAFSDGGVLDRGLEQASRPDNAPLSAGSEPLRVGENTLVVVAEQDDGHAHREIEALKGVGAVASSVTEVVDGRDPLPDHIGKDGLQGFQVGVCIAKDRFHQSPPQWPN
jgi:hypothetical protein